MARYAISAEGAAAFRTLARQLYIEANSIMESSAALEARISVVGDGLGIYEAEILSIVQRGKNALITNRDDILKLAQLLNKKADEIEAFTGSIANPSENGIQNTATNHTSSDINYSKQFHSLVNRLNHKNVAYRQIQPFPGPRTSDQIIGRLSGGDITEGSCSSLALAYAGNKAGYDVLDFRDGESRKFFSSRSVIEKIASIPGVQASVLRGRNDIECANQLLSGMQDGKEYYFASGEHAAVVRKVNTYYYEYLELQHSSTGNGWKVLDNFELRARFRCSDSHLFLQTSFLIDIDSLAANQEFLDLLGYINTAEAEQMKGGTGSVR